MHSAGALSAPGQAASWPLLTRSTRCDSSAYASSEYEYCEPGLDASGWPSVQLATTAMGLLPGAAHGNGIRRDVSTVSSAVQSVVVRFPLGLDVVGIGTQQHKAASQQPDIAYSSVAAEVTAERVYTIVAPKVAAARYSTAWDPQQHASPPCAPGPAAAMVRAA